MVDDWMIVREVAEGVIGAAAVVGNILVLAVILTNPTLRNTTNYLICSLAVADTMVGCIGIPFVIVNNLELPPNFYACLFMNCTIVLFTFVSVFNLVAIALERFIAIRFPIFHRTKVNTKVVFIIIAIAWSCGILVGFIPLFGWHQDPPLEDDLCGFLNVMYFEYLVYFVFFGFMLGPLCVIYITYVYIFFVIFRRGRAIAASGNADKDQKLNLKRESKAAQKIFVVVVVFTLCWLPIHIINTGNFFGVFTYNEPAMIVGILLSHANSAINPFLYAWGNVKIRDALRKMLHIKSNAVQPMDMNSTVSTAQS